MGMAQGRHWVCRLFKQTQSMSMNLPVAPKSMRAAISSGALLPTVWIWSEISVPLQRVIEWMRRGVGLGDWCEDFRGTACLVFSSLSIDCGFNISLIALWYWF